MRITHSKVAVEDVDKPNCEDWNADHVISEVEEASGWQLVEEKEVPAESTTTTFTGLNGDADGKYKLEYELDIVSGGFERFLKMQPNNDTVAGYRNAVHSFSYAGGSPGHTSLIAKGGHVFLLGSTWSDANTKIEGEAIIRAVSGKRRKMEVKVSQSYDDNNFGEDNVLTYWLDTSSNITNLVLLLSGGTFSGNIKLYKWIE